MVTPLAGRRVLLVEDDYFLADEMCRTLEGAGAEVVGPVGRVEEAIGLINDAEHLDAALLDVNVHDVMITPVADLLRQRAVPFCFATGYDQAAMPERHADARRLEKPVEATVVVREILRLIDGE